MRKLDRVARFDAKSLQYPATVGIEKKDFRSYTWACDAWNDQGQEGACVGFGWGHELCARPKVYPVDAQYSFGIYEEAKKDWDEWPGEDYEGTSVLAGAKTVAHRVTEDGKPLITEYRWAFGTADIMRVVGYRGPVVFGTNWYSNMWDTDADGFVHASGDLVGGHCILIRGVKVVFKDPTGVRNDLSNVDWQKSYVLMRNSWGQNWGVNGDCKLSLADLKKLVKENADACIPKGRNL